MGADKRVVGPRPIDTFDASNFLRLVQLEAGIRKLAVLTDKRLGPLQSMNSRDNPAADEVGRLGCIPHREEEPGGKHIAVVFAAELNRPAISLGVPDLEFRIGPIEIFFDELEWRLGRPGFSSRPPDPIRNGDTAGLLPKQRFTIRRTGGQHERK